MHATSSCAAKMRPMLPQRLYYSEMMPLVGKNAVEVRKQRTGGAICTQEMQQLFSCLRKWEFDDLPCASFHQSYMRCVEKAEVEAKKFKEAAKHGTLGDTSGNTLTATQLNKVMKMWPQPDLGQAPYRAMKRLPTQSYADDIFNRKKLGIRPVMSSHKTFIIKRKLAKAAKQNRQLPQWFRMKTGNKIRYNAKRRHWRRTKLKL
ncbi:CHCH domain-containing protein [Aphelenchoides fujianensis]|nr:CHCH domain-containing protein [Aphelenchoides fujianensis]